MVIFFCCAGTSGDSQLTQSPLPDNKPQGESGLLASVIWREARRCERFSGLDLPSVATEMVRRARLIVTASRVGSSESASNTERAKHLEGSGSLFSLAPGGEFIAHCNLINYPSIQAR